MDRGSFGLHFRALRQSLDSASASSLIGAGIRFVAPWDAIATVEVSTTIVITLLVAIIAAAYEEWFGLAMLAVATATAADNYSDFVLFVEAREKTSLHHHHQR